MKDPDRTHRSPVPDATGEKVHRHPLRGRLGFGHGSWRFAMIAIVLVVAAVVVVLVLVEQGTLDRAWAYVTLPVAIVGAAAARVLTIFKASAEGKKR
ncbi:hypothetical protein [Aeromicrobium sp. Leaf350]|uniref:hypothetical protein n=1 Tax=Aeromicrobium sp. Leaf350 TaxID=2876565 RepID=UPI001E318D65|nr:hypothetical protein [Aeromicrobium sp. Leaf350]